MRLSSILSCFTLALIYNLLVSCGSTGGGGYISENQSIRGYNPGVGPFDSNGNYVERWANDKSKGKWWRKSSFTGSDRIASRKKIKIKKPKPSSIAYSPPVRPPSKLATTTAKTPYTTPPPYKPKVTQLPKPTPKPTATKPKPIKPTIKTTPKYKTPIRYTVKKGDTLWSISKKFNSSITTIQSANGLIDTSLRAGAVILIPQY